MYGLADKKGGKKAQGPDPRGFRYDLENQIAKPDEFKKTMTHIDEKSQELKNLLRSGGSQIDLDQWTILLAGYQALKKVLTRSVQTSTNKKG